MRESISYSFVLNMVILFMFVCLAIIAGIFSYYRAFRANTIVINAIEKYEGYNCLSEEESKRKLNTISYDVPFEVNCNNKGGTCMTDTDKNYAVVSYNLDFTGAKYVNVQDFPNTNTINDKYKTMNSTYTCNYYYCTNTKKYQYGVYTYMYIDLPIVSQMIRIPFFSKTKILYEFRDIIETETKKPFDSREMTVIDDSEGIRLAASKYNGLIIKDFLDIAFDANNTNYFIKTDPEYNARKYMQMSYNGKISVTKATLVETGLPTSCGAYRDYSIY